MNKRADIHLAAEMVAEISKILAHKSPSVQGAALVELAAIFIAGHAPELRAAALRLFVETVQSLVPIVEAEAGSPWIRQ